MDMNIGIIGFGWMAFHHYKEILPQQEGYRVLAAYDTDPARTEFAAEFGIQACASLDELLGVPAINTILIATPNQHHKDYSIAALRAGKHVICEKPVTMNAAELEEILAVAKQCGRLFTVHHNRRRDPDYQTVRQVLQAGTIGEPCFIESRVQGANGIPSDWRRTKEAGGGMMFDWGVHLLDQLLQLIDSPVVEVYTQLLCVKYQVDDNLKILLRFANGVCAQVDVMTCCFLPLPRWHVLGSSGTLNVDNWQCDGTIVRGTVEEIDWSLDAVKHAAGSTRTMRPRPESTIETLPLPKFTADFSDFYRDFKDAMQGTRPLAVQPEEVLRTTRLIDLCFQSAAAGAPITGISI